MKRQSNNQKATSVTVREKKCTGPFITCVPSYLCAYLAVTVRYVFEMFASTSSVRVRGPVGVSH